MPRNIKIIYALEEKLGDLNNKVGGTHSYHYALKVRKNEFLKLILVHRISGFVSPVFRNNSAVL
jgi:hypothetical protein